ncbi:MAG: biotin/lipoyl-binding protein, partial [Halieaceae bacterium]|nr:biotin/lipoyl-binding protein [Halieaceae bacterium]
MSEQEQLNEMVQEAPARRGLARRLVDRLFSPWMKDINTAPFDWQQDARAFVEQQPLRARALLYVIALIVIGLVVWASLAKIDEVTRGQGKVIPSRQVQVIQSQDGGVVTEILVREGDLVTKGQLLVSLDQTRSQSSFRENRAEYQALAVKIARLTAVVDKTEFRPDPSLIEAVPGIVNQEQALYESSQ